MNVDWNAEDLANLDLVLDQAEKRLDGTIADFDSLNGTRTKLAALFIVGITGFGGLIVSSPEHIRLASACGGYILALAFWFFWCCYKTEGFALPGMDPETMLVKGRQGLNNQEFKGKLIGKYQVMIEKNARRNKRIGCAINRTLIGLLCFPFVFVLIFLLS